MTLEISKGGSEYMYRLSPTDAHIIDRRQNKHGARWQQWRMFDSLTEAKIELIRLGRAADTDSTDEGKEPPHDD